jgi:hypothetical protein
MDNEEKENITLTENEGAIILRDEGMPEIHTPLGVGDACDSIRFTLAFILYAVDKEDWVEEFGKFVDKMQDAKSDISAEGRRSQFEVIDGDKE